VHVATPPSVAVDCTEYEREARKQIQLAVSFDKQGNAAEAIRCYRAALPYITLYLQSTTDVNEKTMMMEQHKVDGEVRILLLTQDRVSVPVAMPPSGGADFRRYESQAMKHIQLAIALDKQGNVPEAIRYYRAALPQIHLYLQTAPDGHGRSVMERQKGDCERRIAELIDGKRP
jgi:tetratricopeptide (TPR) repeat protein